MLYTLVKSFFLEYILVKKYLFVLYNMIIYIHLRKHTIEKTFFCEKSSKRFSHKSSLDDNLFAQKNIIY